MTLNVSPAMTLTRTSDRELVITRLFNAPRWLVFEACTRPEHIVRWWGLRGSTMPVCEVDLRVGGKWRYVTRGADGVDHGFSGEYREIVSPERIVFTEGYEAMPGHEYIVTATFEEVDGGTRLTNHLRYQSPEDMAGHLASGAEYGMRETYERLDDVLAGELENRATIITRMFDAPREKVWQAWTDCQHLTRWWGPKDWTSPTCQIDLRVGGRYIFSMRSPEGEDMYSTGVYHEIVPVERLVFTDSFSDSHGSVVSPESVGMGGDFPRELVVRLVFEDLGGKTKMTLTHVGMPKGSDSEMAVQGWNESFDKLVDSLH